MTHTEIISCGSTTLRVVDEIKRDVIEIEPENGYRRFVPGLTRVIENTDALKSLVLTVDANYKKQIPLDQWIGE